MVRRIKPVNYWDALALPCSFIAALRGLNPPEAGSNPKYQAIQPKSSVSISAKVALG